VSATPLSRLLVAAHAASRWAVWVGGTLTIASVLLIAYDVVVRRLFGVSVGGSDELSGYAFAVSTSWALAFTALERGNVRVDVLYRQVPPRGRAALDWLALVSLGVFAVFLTFHAYDVAMTSWTQKAAANTPLATPLWIPQTLWVLGLVWFCAVLALMLLRASAALVAGDLAALNAVCGVVSSEEEAAVEAAAGERIVQEERA
jgi:TRAP-type C4-dicarboxylate transport system permease small subunit